MRSLFSGVFSVYYGAFHTQNRSTLRQFDIRSIQIFIYPLVELLQPLAMEVLGPTSDLSLAEKLLGKLLLLLVRPKALARRAHGVNVGAVAQGVHLLLAVQDAHPRVPAAAERATARVRRPGEIIHTSHTRACTNRHVHVHIKTYTDNHIQCMAMYFLMRKS